MLVVGGTDEMRYRIRGSIARSFPGQCIGIAIDGSHPTPLASVVIIEAQAVGRMLKDHQSCGGRGDAGSFAFDMRGIRIPFVLLFTSRIALVLAVLPSVLMATDWASRGLAKNRAMAVSRQFLFIVFGFNEHLVNILLVTVGVGRVRAIRVIQGSFQM